VPTPVSAVPDTAAYDNAVAMGPPSPADAAEAAPTQNVVAPSIDEPAVSAADGTAAEALATTVPLPPEQADLWARIRQGFAMPNLDTPLVRQAENRYRNDPEYIARMVERSRRYLYYIVGQVQKRQMPTEIALLPMIESAFNPLAYSRSRASGIWQFMPSTGKLYGMKQNWWLDERRDIVAATDGALDYLQRLYAEFGDWHLALAAYNWGEGSVRRAIASNAKRGLPTDYLSLKMPAETRAYVPQLQAIENIVADPKAYGLKFASIPDAPYFSVVTTNRQMDVKTAVALAEMSEEEFLSLNPQHNRPVIAGADATTILLPYDKAGLFAAKLALTDQPMVTWQAYKLKTGETMAQVAQRFGLPLETLLTVNGIGQRATVPPNHMLLVPSQMPSIASAASLQNAVFTAVPETQTFYHRVGKGETLTRIAARYHVSVKDLQTWNVGLKSTVKSGQRLRVVSDFGAPKGHAPTGKHRRSQPPASAATTAANGARKAPPPTLMSESR
jgi:peptidoglycan lytic transglycosylase D